MFHRICRKKKKKKEIHSRLSVQPLPVPQTGPDRERPSHMCPPMASSRRRGLPHVKASSTFFLLCFSSAAETRLHSPAGQHSRPRRHVQTSHRLREAQADQHQGHRGRGERGRAEEGLQPPLALHPGQGQEHCNAPGLLLCPGAHCQGSPGGQMDPDAAVLLRGRPQGKDRRPLYCANRKLKKFIPEHDQSRITFTQ